MKRVLVFLLCAVPLLTAPWACKEPIPPFVPAPLATPTATVTPGCQTSGLDILTGSGTLGSPTTLSLTPVPTATPSWSWSGSVPPHPAGVFLIQTAADWNNFVSASYVPGGSFPISFNPATQAMVVVATVGFCPDIYNISSVCNNGSQITVQVNDHQSCCPTYPVIQGIYNSSGFQALIINNFGLPVVINQTYFPWIGPLCV